MLRKRSTSVRGVSLVEVLMALVFLVFGLAGVMDLYLVQSAQAARAQRLARADSLAQSYLAHLQETGYAALAENLRLKAELPTAEEADLFPIPTRSELDPDFQWNATLRRENRDGVACIRIAVSTYWFPVQGVGRADERDRKKEAVGHVAAP